MADANPRHRRRAPHLGPREPGGSLLLEGRGAGRRGALGRIAAHGVHPTRLSPTAMIGTAGLVCAGAAAGQAQPAAPDRLRTLAEAGGPQLVQAVRARRADPPETRPQLPART